MKILHIISSLDTGGAQSLIASLLPHIAHEGHDVTLAVYRDSDSHLAQSIKDNPDIKYVSLDAPSFKSPSIIPALRRLIRKSDITHVHLFPSLYQVAAASFGLKTPLVYTEHSTHNRRRTNPLLRPLERFVYSRYSNIISISDKTQEALATWLCVNPTRFNMNVVYNGIDQSAYDIPTPSSEMIFGRPGRPIVMVSRFVPAKDHATLIRAFSLLNGTDAFLAFAGDGETLNSCRQLAADLNISDNVLFLGNRNDVPRLLKAAYIGVQASEWEGFGLTAVEIMTAGIPLVCSDVPGLRDVAGDAALRFQPADYHTLSTHLDNLLNDDLLYKRLIDLGFQQASKFDIRSTAKHYCNIYNRLIFSAE